MITNELGIKVKKLRKQVKKLRKRADASDAEVAALREKVDDRDIRIEKLSTAMRQFASRLGKLDGGG
jgi:uncharacterized coiled-coil DUF342 family protein